jgi:hypothetical protein
MNRADHEQGGPACVSRDLRSHGALRLHSCQELSFHLFWLYLYCTLYPP